MVIEFTGVYIKVNPAAKLSVLCGIVRPAYQGICCLVKSKPIVPQWSIPGKLVLAFTRCRTSTGMREGGERQSIIFVTSDILNRESIRDF